MLPKHLLFIDSNLSLPDVLIAMIKIILEIS